MTQFAKEDGISCAGTEHPFATAIAGIEMPMVLTDPRQADNPIVFTNTEFHKLVGYEIDELIGRNCRFLQGPDTDPEAVTAIRTALRTRTEISLDLLNYRKHGTAFWNALHISPVFSGDGVLQFFFASQLDVTDHVTAKEALRWQNAMSEDAGNAPREQMRRDKAALLRDVEQRVKSNLSMINSLVCLRARSLTDEGFRDVLTADLSNRLTRFAASQGLVA